MNKEVLKLGIASYQSAVGWDDMDKDADGFVVLKPSAKHTDAKKAELTTNITDLEAKLKKFKAEKAKISSYQKTDDYKESKKKQSKKKQKKKRDSLLSMVFNNADAVSDEEDPDLADEVDEDEDGSYRDSRKTKARANREKNKKNETTLDTTYGKRFSPIVSMLYDTITEFDSIATDIDDDLRNPRNQGKTMYRSSQISNLISAKNSKLSAVKELAGVAKTVSDLEYKKDKDRQNTEGGDTSKAISMLGAKYLRGADIFGDPKKKKKDKDKKSKYKDDDTDDDDIDDGIKKQRSDDERALAAEFAKTIIGKKGDISMTAHERFAAMEGKFTVKVVADSIDPDNSWKFIAVEPKSGKEIKDFKDDYPGLLPKKKNCRMVFDLSRLTAYDKNSARTYKLLLKN